MTPPDELRFASLFVYPSNPGDAAAREAKAFALRVKTAQADAVERAVALVKEHWNAGRFRDFLGSARVLVPVPGHAPRRAPDWIFPTKALCDRLVAEGLGRSVCPLVARATKVPKSAWVSPSERPTPEMHSASMSVGELPLDIGREITIVDDVVTRGATFLGVARVLRTAINGLEPRAFAFFRVESQSHYVGVDVDAVENGQIDIGPAGPRRRP